MTEQAANWALHCDELCLTLLKSSTLSRCVSWQMQRLRNFCHSFRTSSLWAWKYNEGSWYNSKQHSGWKGEAVVVNGLFKYLYCVTGRVLQFNKSLAFILEFVHLGLVGQQTVVLEILNEIKSKLAYLCVIHPGTEQKQLLSFWTGRTLWLVSLSILFFIWLKNVLIPTSYCLRTSGGSTIWSLQSCFLILFCSSARKFSSLLQPCMYSYRLLR